MLFCIVFLFAFSKEEVIYKVTHDILTISGSGSITYQDVVAYGSQSTVISAIIEEGITAIEDKGFTSCSLLQNVSIPSSVVTIGSSPFHRCKSLTRIIVADNNTFFSNDEQGALYNKEKTILIRAPMNTSFQVPEKVTTIKSLCFSGSASNLFNYSSKFTDHIGV